MICSRLEMTEKDMRLAEFGSSVAPIVRVMSDANYNNLINKLIYYYLELMQNSPKNTQIY